MTIRQLSATLPVAVCEGGCGLSGSRHRRGCVFLNVVHFADRRLTYQTAARLLLLAARAVRAADPGYLNSELFDFYYAYHDAVWAYRHAESVGIRLPRRAFDRQRAECRRLAARRGVHLSAYRRVWSWARG